ncbi:MAG: ankyrin repeat domain-containing protein [Puniceicoccales bacterium]|jgi:ankyrin repeat protein|nr:ankyrin repeat domain-containing protein [Puniceicoccales bacterium]
MEKKCGYVIGKRALIVGLVFSGSSMVLQGAVPDFSNWTDRSKLDSRIAIGSEVASIDAKDLLINKYILNNGKMDPNQKVCVGTYLPVIFYAATINKVTTDSTGGKNMAEIQATDALKTLLANNSTIVSVETALGNTPMHAAAINSADCLQLLIDDGRLDVNEHNNNGETPLYVAMAAKNDETIAKLKLASRTNYNSRDVKGRTILHVAVQQANKDVIAELFTLTKSGSGEGDPKKLDIAILDNDGKKAEDYINDIIDSTLKTEITGLFTTYKGAP